MRIGCRTPQSLVGLGLYAGIITNHVLRLTASSHDSCVSTSLVGPNCFAIRFLHGVVEQIYRIYDSESTLAMTLPVCGPVCLKPQQNAHGKPYKSWRIHADG